jgi:hypothetical protein|nr:MAG TPA: hypothetical protein [Caudoviricetes sp.]
MIELLLKKFEKNLAKDYPDYTFFITEEMQEEDFIRNSVICEISGITVLNSKNYTINLNFYITKPKIQDDLGQFIVQTLDIQKKIQELDINKTFYSDKLAIEFGELKAKEVKDTFRVSRISGQFNITRPVENILKQKEIYMRRLFVDKKEVID